MVWIKAHEDGDKEFNEMKAFLRLGPFVNYSKIKICLGKAHDHSLFVYPFCMLYVYM